MGDPIQTSTESSAPPIAGFHHVGLTVTDVSASEAWYERVLGMQRVMVEEHGDGGHTVVMARPDAPLFIGLAHHERNAAETFAEHRTGLDHVSLAVATRAELDGWRDHLDALGIPHSGVTERTEPFEYALLVFRDPDNIQLEVTWS
ncbi:VOC family protein [Pseudonocardia bannensis]|uniref:VOC family protein n=1 Tax=Pseudonocardia bannensis TaxID=630973 RepID=A0A848DD19_9PSEU|nr:VOC family protein [Pseudonocardia bannensis]NMH90490.1 VOC family protein [Pseudonocardia bannensis]